MISLTSWAFGSTCSRARSPTSMAVMLEDRAAVAGLVVAGEPVQPVQRWPGTRRCGAGEAYAGLGLAKVQWALS